MVEIFGCLSAHQNPGRGDVDGLSSEMQLRFSIFVQVVS
jgi:hypothetical protein